MPPKHGFHCEECRAPLVPVYVLYACRVPVCPYARKGKGKRTWTLDNEGKGKRTLNLQGEEQDHVGKGKRTLNLQGEEQDRMHHWRGSLEITAVASTPMPQAQSSEGNIARLEGGTEVLLRPKAMKAAKCSRSPRRNHLTTHPQEMNDHNLLREMLKNVVPGWEGYVLSGNCENAKGEGDPQKIATSNRLYALWETQERENKQKETQSAASQMPQL